MHRCRFLGGVVAEHMHFTQGKAPKDETYERNRISGRNYYQLDGAIFDSDAMREKRIEDAEKLKKVMK